MLKKQGTNSVGVRVGATDDAVSIITEAAGEDANIIFGSVIDASLEDRLMVTVIATGFNKRTAGMRRPAMPQSQSPRQSQSKAAMHIPTGINEIREYDEPTFIRKGLSLAPTQDYDTDQDTQRIEKSNPDRPAFLRKILD